MATLVLQQVELIADIASLGSQIVKIIGIVFISRVFVEVAHLVIEEVLLKHRGLSWGVINSGASAITFSLPGATITGVMAL